MVRTARCIRGTMRAFARVGLCLIAAAAFHAYAATVVSVAIEGPDTIDSLTQASVRYGVRETYSDGTSQLLTSALVIGVTPPDRGKIDSDGWFRVFRPGTMTLTYFRVGGNVTKTVTIGSTPAAFAPFDPDCPAVETPVGADHVLRSLRTAGIHDILPLCDGLLLLANRAFNRIQLMDMTTRQIVRNWQLDVPPLHMARVKGTPYVFLVLSAPKSARINLATGEVRYFDTAYPSFQTFYEPFAVVEGEKGEVWINTGGLQRFDVETLELLGRGEVGGWLMAYDRLHRRLFAATSGFSPSELMSYSYSPSSGQLTFVESVRPGSNGQDLSVSPNGRHLAFANGAPYLIYDLDPADLATSRGAWPTGAYPSAAHFRFDGKKLLASNGRELFVYDVATYGADATVELRPLECAYIVLSRARWSPMGRNYYVLADCGSDEQIIRYAASPAPLGLGIEKSGAGGGLVISSPGVMHCGDDCIDSYEPGTVVTLSATEDLNSTFNGWTGCPAPSGSLCVVTMSGATEIGVRFKANQAISFAPVQTQYIGNAPFALTVSASSGLPPALEAGPAGVCTLSGNVVTLAGAGTCTVVASQPGNPDDYNAAASVSRSFLVEPPDARPRLGNISTRIRVGTGNDVLIGGFVIGGSANKTVVVRVRGPSLAAFGITNPLANPLLQLVRSSDQTQIAANDDWQASANAAAISASGFAPGNALESAILMSLPPGAYTAIVSGVGGATGVAIIEVFEVDHPEVPLANISTRGRVLNGNDVMIGGFVVQGTAPKTVVIRARGPSLVPFGITNALANPSLQLVRSSDQLVIAENADWQSNGNAAAIAASGFAPSDPLEAALLVTLDPGAYTVIVTGWAGGTGVAIIEVFAQ